MPIYEYECTKCAHQFELEQAMTDRPRSRCPRCRSKVQRLISGGFGISFKGSGYYINDSRPAAKPTTPKTAACESCPASSDCDA